MDIYKFVQPILFKLEPEFAHKLACKSLKISNKLGLVKQLFQVKQFNQDSFELFGIKFKNKLGLAAGLDKNGEYLDIWEQLGFGFVEIGTVTPKSQVGNPKPRLFRDIKNQALINKMGFNNNGVDSLLKNIKNSNYTGVLGINIGKNKDTPLDEASQDYIYCLKKAYNYADYFTINISSPNTANLRQLQSKEYLSDLLDNIKLSQNHLAEENAKYKPILVKLSPDLEEKELYSACDLIIEKKIDGIILANTTINYTSTIKNAAGGLSGAPLTDKSRELLIKVRDYLGKDFPIISVGGINSIDEALARFNSGADLIQLYTSFIYQGPKIVQGIREALA